MSTHRTELADLANTLALAVEASMDRLAGEVSAVKDGVRLRGAETFPVANGSDAYTTITTVPNRLMGYMIAETTGTSTARIQLLDGDTGGPVMGSITLAAGESARDYFGPAGVALVNGLTVHILSGSIDGAIFLGPRG